MRRRLQRDLEDAVAERRLGAGGDGAFGQRNRSVEAAVVALAPVPTLAILLVLFLAFALQDHGVVADLDADVLFLHAREIGVDHELVAAAPHVDLRRPLSGLLPVREADAPEADVLEETVHLVVPAMKERAERRRPRAERRERIATAERTGLRLAGRSLRCLRARVVRRTGGRRRISGIGPIVGGHMSCLP